MDDRDGEVVARGRIRVDARKALDKLREHMLVDPHLYACELARVAVARGARAVEVTEADGAITYGFSGTLGASEAAGARDEVLGGDTAQMHPVRLLGIAVSAALSLRCEVEILTDATRIRFADATSAPQVSPAETVPGTVRMTVRSGLGATIGRVLVGAAPRRELALLRAAAEGGPLAIMVDGEPAPRPPAAPFVLRIPLADSEATLAVLDVLDPALPVAAEVVFREHGLRLAAYPLDFARIGSHILPLRVTVDAARLPTNASRSEVRFDGGLAERVLRSAEAMLDRIVATLDSAVVRGAAVDRSFVVGDEAAFGRTLAAFAVAAARAGGPIVAGAAHRTRRLLALPLLDDAFGAPLSLARVLGSARVLVHDGASPLSTALEGVIGSGRGVLVWKHGRPAEEILHDLVTLPADDVVAQAVVGAERRARALEHPSGPPRLEEGRVWQLRQTFAVDEGVVAGLVGEIGVARDGALPSARLFVEGRFLETVALPGVRLPIELAIAWPRRLAPTLAYDAVERGDSLSVAIDQAVRVAALAVAEHTADDPELVRLATIAWAAAARTLGDDTADTLKLPRFADAPVWPLTSGGMTSLRELDRYASTHGGFVCTAPASSAAAIDGRPVIHEAYAQLVGEILANVRFVPYGRFLGRSRAGIEPPAPLAVRVVRPGIEGWLLPGHRARHMYHAGVSLGETELPKVRHDLDLVYEDDGAIPDADGRGAHWSTPLWLTGEEAELERLVVEQRRKNVPSSDASSSVAPVAPVVRPVPPALPEPRAPAFRAEALPVLPTPRLAPDPWWAETAPPHAATAAPPAEASFLDSFVRHARALFEPKPDVLGTSPLTQALSAALSGLALTGRPVEAVVEGTRGRPLRYEPEHRRVVVNVRHRAIARLAADPERLTHLLLAATSEINRELVAVTDAEEIAVLCALLRANADR